jgi:DHA3 family macrolide efflux protein-like MFS transporter
LQDLLHDSTGLVPYFNPAQAVFFGDVRLPLKKDHWKRNLALFMSSQTISLLGSSLVQYAMLWHITLQTKSGAMMTLYIICGFVPTFILSPFAGVWADRYDRKRLIILSDAMIALVTLGLALAFMAGYQAVWLLLLGAALRAVGSSIQGPAVGAILPQIVPEDKLIRANGLNGTIQSAIMLISPILSGALLTLASLELIFFIDVVTAAIAILVLLVLKVATHAKAAGRQESSYFTDMMEGFRYIRDHRYLVSYFAYIGFFLFLISPAAFLTPLQVARSFGEDVWRLTAIEMIFSVGMLAGGVLISSWGGFRNRMHTMVVSNLVMAACAIALALVPSFWLYLLVMGVFGLSMPLYNTPSAVIIQEHVEPDFLGRVFSVLTMLFTSIMPLAMLLFGPIADTLPIEWLLLGTGGIMLVLGSLVFRNRRLMEAGLPVARAAEAVTAG